MKSPSAPNGIYEGGILFDGCDYRTPDGIVDFAHDQGKLGIVRKKNAYFRAEFLTRRHSPQFSLPVWDESRERVICGSEEEAKRLILEFVNPENENRG